MAHLSATLVRPFDWAELSDFDRHPHLLIMGRVASGKTTLTRKLLRSWDCDALVLDPDGTAETWQEIPVLGSGQNYAEIGLAIGVLTSQIEERVKQNGFASFRPMAVVIDQVPQILSRCPYAGCQLEKLATSARKANVRLVVLSQDLTDELKFKRQDCKALTPILLGEVMHPLPEPAQTDLSAYGKPCLVGSRVADIDHLSDTTIRQHQERGTGRISNPVSADQQISRGSGRVRPSRRF